MATGSSAPEAPRSTTESAERILAERLARGDIDQAEYQSRLSALRS
nr:SHOCT domain-containing protein [Aeromicrobium stalagmiti]